MSTTATEPVIRSGETSQLSASDAARLAAWYTRYALDRLGDGPRRFHPGVRAHLIAACVQHDAAGKVLRSEHDRVTKDGHDEG